jgi:hypothetical protein
VRCEHRCCCPPLALRAMQTDSAATAAAGGGAPLRFTPLSFAHNGRVALALVPATALLASAAGTPGVGIALVGAMVTYLLDLLRMGEGALGCVWVSLVSVYLSLVFGAGVRAPHRPPLLEVVMLLGLGQTLFLLGVWATLQVRARGRQRRSACSIPRSALFHAHC